MSRKLIAAVVLSAIFPSLAAADPPNETRLPLSFVENIGQWDTPARFVARRGPMTARFETGAIILQLEQRETQDKVKGVVVRMAFEDARDDVTLEGGDRQPGRYNFFLGDDRSKWRSEVPAYSQVLYRGLYDGVDLLVREQDRRLEYDVLLTPGADLSQVTFRCEGIDGLDIDSDGSLLMHTAVGVIRQKPPIAWYELPGGERVPVECRFCTGSDMTFGFDISELDSSHALVIDPGLEWSTLIGASGETGDGVWIVTVDESGIVTAGGWAGAADFPATSGAYDEEYTGPLSIFVARLDPDQVGEKQLLWSTFVDGEGFDVIGGMAVDAADRVIVAGWTNSVNFPTTPDAYQTMHNGSYDVFAFRLSAQGNRLEWSTLLGGSSDDSASDVAVTRTGNVVVGGYTSSQFFPTTDGAYDPTFNGGGQDGFVVCLDPDQTGNAQLVWSTFLGGTGNEGAPFAPLSFDTDHMAVALDTLGRVTVTGGTSSANFPTTKGAYDRTYGGGSDGFALRLSASGANLLWSTYLGGSNGREPGQAVHVDANGVVTTAGYTWSADYPTTDGAFDTTHGASNDGFVTRLDPSQVGEEQLVYSTFVGGNSFDPILAIKVDDLGIVTAAGATNSTDFPVTADAYDPSANAGLDGFLFRLKPGGDGQADLLYSTYLGGIGDDGATTLSLHGPNHVIVGGFTTSIDFPVTAGAYDETHNSPGFQDGFVSRLDLATVIVCPWDCEVGNADGIVGIIDFLTLLAQWGGPGSCDFDGGGVGINDFLELLANWGPCK